MARLVNRLARMKFVTILAGTAIAIGFATPANAQPGAYVPPPAPQPQQTDEVDEGVALGLSLGGTVLSWGLLIAGGSFDNEGLTTVGALGTMLAPSFGHWYARKPLTRGLGLRVVGVGFAMAAFVLVLDDLFSDSEDRSNDEDTAGILLLLGAGSYVVGTVDDIGTAAATARKYNERRFKDVTVVPTANANGGGVSLIGRF